MPTVTLTERDVVAAKAEKGQRLELWDAKSPGLCLRVTDRGLKTWFVRYRTLDGRQPRFSLGNYPALKLAEARDLATDAKRAAREGKDPAALRKAAITAAKAEPLRTVEDLAEAYFRAAESGKFKATKRGKKPATIAAERSLWRSRLKPEVGSKRIDDLTRRQVKAALERIAEAAPIQSNRARALLSVMFTYAIAEERVSVSPVAGVGAQGTERARDRVLTDEELKAVLRGLANPSALTITKDDEPMAVQVGKPVALALRLALLTLQRRGEVAGMRVDELRLDEGSWTLSGDRTKNGVPHFVPLTPEAVATIRDALALRDDEKSPYVFPSPWKRLSGPIGAGALTHALVDIYVGLGISGATVHDLRRTGATVMASERLKVSPVVISRILNHTIASGGAAITAKHYALYDYAAEKRAALEAWSALLARLED